MSTAPVSFDAGRPRVSGPIRRIARPFGPLDMPIAGTWWFPFYAILRHTGRTSGKAYSTPVVALRTHDGFIIPLPFGNATQWARNLFASAGGALRFAGTEYQVVEPQVVDHELARAYLPPLVRVLSARLGLREFVLVRKVSG